MATRIEVCRGRRKLPKIRFTGKASDFLKIGAAASARGDVEAVRAILEERPGWLTRVGSRGRTMLWEASHRGRLGVVEYLVEGGADIDACGTHYTPYFVEVSCYCIARHKKSRRGGRLPQGARGGLRHSYRRVSRRPVMALISLLKRHPELLNEGHPQHVMGDKTEEGLELLSGARPVGDSAVLRTQGRQHRDGRVPHRKRSENREYRRNRYLTRRTRTRIRCAFSSKTGLILGRWCQCFPMMGELFALVSSYGVPPPDVEEAGARLVYLCRGDRGGNPDEVMRLLRLGADVNHRDAQGKTALHRAAKAGFTVTMGVSVGARGVGGHRGRQRERLPLFDAIRSTIKDGDRKAEAIRTLLKAGADPVHANGRGETAMEVADRVGVELAF